MEPSRKVKRMEDYEIKEMIGVIQDMFCDKLQNIEEKIEKITSKYSLLEKKVDMLISTVQGSVGDVSCTTSSIEDSTSENSAAYNEAEYPDGSWLGDPDNPEFCLRCPITSKDLEYINNHCTSAEKMSLMLLDYLFPREVQACSNLSGLGKYGKKQLDPYKIQAIMWLEMYRNDVPVREIVTNIVLVRESMENIVPVHGIIKKYYYSFIHIDHVMYKFGITTNDWNRIKLNIDSKCRTAFRRKVRGLPVNVRGKKGRPFYTVRRETDDSNECDLSSVPKTLNSECDIFNQSCEPRSDEDHSFTEALSTQIESISSFTFPISANAEIIDTEQRRITVIQATEEQYEMLKQNPNIEILSKPDLPS